MSIDAEDLWLTNHVRVRRAARYVDWYRSHVRHGPTYYALGDSGISDDEVTIHDLGWAVLLEGRPASRAAQALVNESGVDISTLPNAPLETLSDEQCDLVVDGIVSLVRLDGFASSLATKVLHPKRRGTVPVLDNGAIYGAFLREGYQPGDAIQPYSIRAASKIRSALLAVRDCLRRPENEEPWAYLSRTFTTNRLELFDMIWWTVTRAGNEQLGEEGVFRLRG